jgi:hypothetical protein
VVALEHAGRLRLVEDVCSRPDELLVELALVPVVAAVPALASKGLQRSPALLDPVERAHAAAHLQALRELFHGAECALRRGRAVACFV